MRSQNPFGNRGFRQRQMQPTVIPRRKRVPKDDGAIERADLDFLSAGILRHDETLQIVTSTFLEVRGASKRCYLRICDSTGSSSEHLSRRVILRTFDGFRWVSDPLIGPCLGAGWQVRMLDEIVQQLTQGVLDDINDG